MVRQRFSEQSGLLKLVRQGSQVRWQPPMADWLKVNSDVAIHSHGSYIVISI